MRGHKGKLAKVKFRTDITKYLFHTASDQCVNSLPGHVVEAETLGLFKTRLDMVKDTFLSLGKQSIRCTSYGLMVR